MSKYQENVGPYDGLTVSNAALLLIDHQVGLMQLVRDMAPEEFKNNVIGLAKTAKNFSLPVILTTSVDWGPNGVILPELKTDVHAVIDASGAVSILERETTVATLSQVGVKVRNWWSVGAELQADWRIDEVKGWPYAMIFREHLPKLGATCSIPRLPTAPGR